MENSCFGAIVPIAYSGQSEYPIPGKVNTLLIDGSFRFSILDRNYYLSSSIIRTKNDPFFSKVPEALFCPLSNPSTPFGLTAELPATGVCTRFRVQPFG